MWNKFRLGHKMQKTLKTILYLFAAAVMTGCSSADVPEPLDDRCKVTIIIPPVDMTRASYGDNDDNLPAKPDNQIGSGEARIDPLKGLWFYAFPSGTDAVTVPVVRQILLDVSDGSVADVGNGHTKVTFPIAPGKYNIYVAGNIKPIAEMEAVTTEEDLLGMAVSYMSGNNGKLPSPDKGGLPMWHDKVEVEVTSGTAAEVDLHLSFLCAKVRFTYSGELGDVTVSSIPEKSLLNKEKCEAMTVGKRFVANIAKPIYDEAKRESIVSFYLPEYYLKEGNATVDMVFKVADVADDKGNFGKSYTLKLGGGEYEDGEVSAIAGGDIPRHTFYDIKCKYQMSNLKVSVNNWSGGFENDFEFGDGQVTSPVGPWDDRVDNDYEF